MSGCASVSRGAAVGRLIHWGVNIPRKPASQNKSQPNDHAHSVQQLASLFRGNNDTRPVFLLGAGASFSSGVPLAADAVKRIARRVYAEHIRGGALHPHQVKLTEWQTWLHGHEWFIAGEDRLAENFPYVIEHLLNPSEYRRKVLLELMQPANALGEGYRRLAQLVMKGLTRTVLTTNFDTCLTTALNQLRPHIRHVTEVNRSRDDLAEFNLFNRAQIVWLHGKAEQYSDRNVLEEVETLTPRLAQELVPLIDSSPLVVVGYRGAEPSIMEHLLGKVAKRAPKFRNGIYWCIRPGETPHPNVESLKRAVGRNFQLLTINGFDELLVDLSALLADEDLYQKPSSISAPSRSAAFDDTPAIGAALTDLDADLMLAVMRDYCAELHRNPVDSRTLPALLREQGLLVSVGGQDVPTEGCLLLFGKDPQARLPHAIVTATISGKKRRIFTGNLIQQRNELLEWLQAEEVNPTLRIKRRATHEKQPAFEPRALVELLINMLVHRDYSLGTPSSIEVHDGAISFNNAGALPDAAATKVVLDAKGRFRPVPLLSELRNSALCDVFFAINTMERGGTGLTDVDKLTRDLGGEASFVHDAKNQRFTATLRQPQAIAGSTTVARDPRPSGEYVLNILRLVSIPDKVSILPLRDGIAEFSDDFDRTDGATFIIRGREREVWSFAPLALLKQLLKPYVVGAKSTAYDRSTLEQDVDSKRALSWLIRAHFERFLRGFERHGLALAGEERRSRRAYFIGRKLRDAGRPRTITYATPKRRRVDRRVVKQRAEGDRAWFENEGFGYQVISVDREWGVRLKPFYMFTGPDAETPLPGFARAARATRRIKFDRNKNVEDDLTFWSRFIGEGQTVVNIGQQHVTDLLLETAFITVEVAEEDTAIREESGEDQNRKSA